LFSRRHSKTSYRNHYDVVTIHHRAAAFKRYFSKTLGASAVRTTCQKAQWARSFV
jgi:hypothetical protein